MFQFKLNVDGARSLKMVNLLFLKIKDLLAREWSVNICHISRSVNRVADAMAKLDLSRNAIFGDCSMYLKA